MERVIGSSPVPGTERNTKHMKRLRLNILSIYKYLFFLGSMLFNLILFIVDVLFLIFTLGKIDPRMSSRFSSWCIKHLDGVLQKEFKILFKRETQNIKERKTCKTIST